MTGGVIGMIGNYSLEDSFRLFIIEAIESILADVNAGIYSGIGPELAEICTEDKKNQQESHSDFAAEHSTVADPLEPLLDGVFIDR